MTGGARPDPAAVQAVTADIGKRKVLFYPLTRAEVDLIDTKRSSVSGFSTIASTATGVAFTLGCQSLFGDFSKFSAVAKASMYIAIPVSMVIAATYWIKWFKSNSDTKSYIQNKLNEIERDA